MDLYSIFLHAHSGIRWLTLLLVAIILIKSLMGLFGNASYGKTDNILAASFVGTMDLQFLIGLILYFFLSPITQTAIADFGAAMKNPGLRFFAVEHLTMMIAAIAIAHIGRSKAKKSYEAKKKFKFQVIFFGIALALMLIGIPWDRL